MEVTTESKITVDGQLYATGFMSFWQIACGKEFYKDGSKNSPSDSAISTEGHAQGTTALKGLWINDLLNETP